MIIIILFDLRRVMMKKSDHQQRKSPKHGPSVHDVMNRIFYVEIGRSSKQLFLRFQSVLFRFIPRRIDLDRDYALDALVAQNRHIQSRIEPENNGQIISIEQQQQFIRQQRRTHKRANQQTHSDSSKKTLELLEHFMPQNRRIYNFGVKTLKPRPIGSNVPLTKEALSSFISF